MSVPPKLATERLLLRPFTAADAPAVQRFLAERDVAATTANIPHPYPKDGAKSWIASHAERHRRGEAAIFAITTAGTAGTESDCSIGVVGAIGLHLVAEHAHAELGYWIAKPYWGRGFATEAARAVLRHGFEALDLHRIFARHMTRNPASGRVMAKLGMRHEGRQRDHLYRFGKFEDLELWALLRDEFAPPAIGGRSANR